MSADRAFRAASGTVLVVDGAGVCRAPIVGFTLRKQLAGSLRLSAADVAVRGLEAEAARTMCETAQVRLGYTGPAIAYFGAFRAERLTVSDIAGADLMLTAERQQRSAVVRMLPGTQASVFTWKEALVLASVVTDRVRQGAMTPPADLPALAAALHSVRGTVPMIEPSTRTGVFHLRRGGGAADALTVPAGHDDAGEKHRHAVAESWRIATALGARLVEASEDRRPAVEAERPPARWWRQRTGS